jgi:large subunit ribosomal protein L7e
VRGEAIKLKRPEQFINEANIRKGSQQKMARRRSQVEATTTGSLIPKGDKMKDTVGFMVRIHMGRHASKEIKKQLRELGLNKKYDAAFVKLDRDGIAKLRCIDAYVAYGYISNKNVVELVHRRAYITENKERKPLSDNIVVEKLLGDKDMLCLADMSHEIYSVGANFEAATGLLCTFQLSAPIGAYEKKVLQVHDKVEEMGGFLGERMEDFLNKIL